MIALDQNSELDRHYRWPRAVTIREGHVYGKDKKAAVKMESL
jgi:hypothetical protein